MSGEFLDRVPWAVMDGWAWLVIGLLVAGALLHRRNERAARLGSAAGWVAFAGFWAAMVPHFYYYEASVIKAVLSLVAVPASLYGARKLLDSAELLLLSRAIAFMGVIYLPFITSDTAQAVLIETVTRHVEFVFSLTSYTPEVVYTDQGLAVGELRNAFQFPADENGGPYRLNVILACTGIGAISIFGGLIGAVDAPPRRKLLGLAVVVPIIWALNLARVVFISIAHGHQWFYGVMEGPVMAMFATDEPTRVSFLISDKIMAQSVSVVALVGLTFLVVKLVPQVVEPLEDATELLTGTEADLAAAMGVEIDREPTETK